MKKYLALISCIVTVWIILFGLTFRGSVGNPTPEQIEQLKNSGQAFETSQERSRYAIILSLYHDKTFSIDNYAAMGTPDVGHIKGHYYSFFPPAASLISMPFFLIGQHFGMAQIATFFTSTLFTLLTMILMAKFGLKLGLHWSTALFSAFGYAFATNAWGYSVTLYAHPFSAFFLLLALYATVFWKNWKGSILFWLCYSMGLFLDFPNIFIFFPLALVQGFRFIPFEIKNKAITIRLRWSMFFPPFIFILCLLGYGYYNYVHFGNPTLLSNSIPRVKSLEEFALRESQRASQPTRQASASDSVSALNTRDMLNGFYSFILSPDRGILVYSPVALLAIFGLGFLHKNDKEKEVLLLTVPLMCLVLYSMFGDPYGGWAFGSRYMIAVMPELLILAALGLNRFSQWYSIRVGYSLVFAYSAGISLLAPLTTLVIPPLVEGKPLGIQSNYLLAWKMLEKDILNSFFYNHVLQRSLAGTTYYFIVLSIILTTGLVLIWWPKKKYD